MASVARTGLTTRGHPATGLRYYESTRRTSGLRPRWARTFEGRNRNDLDEAELRHERHRSGMSSLLAEKEREERVGPGGLLAPSAVEALELLARLA